MSVYFVANISIHDAEEYQRYLQDADRVFARFNGEYLAVDRAPRVLEGEWTYDRVVIIRFPQEADLLRWYESPEYRRILAHRLAGARCDTLLVHGKSEKIPPAAP